MSFIEFDAAKNAQNIRTRGIAFERFAEMDLETAISVEDTREDYGERRLRVLGTSTSCFTRPSLRQGATRFE